MKATAIVQARMTSTRLPGKVLMKVLDRPLLLFQLERLRRCRTLDRIVLAITENERDLPLVEFCDTYGCDLFRGSEDDVLDRYYRAAVKFGVGTIVRITSDCPLIDPAVVDEVVDFYLDNRDKYNYVSNIIERTYPRGMDCEVFTWNALECIHNEAATAKEREHVTLGIYTRPDIFRLGSVTGENDYSHHRWTVDCAEDFELIKRMIEALYPTNPEFSMHECLALLDQQPGWLEINAHVEQKKVNS